MTKAPQETDNIARAKNAMCGLVVAKIIIAGCSKMLEWPGIKKDQGQSVLPVREGAIFFEATQLPNVFEQPAKNVSQNGLLLRARAAWRLARKTKQA